jgi:hypothetical protein
MCGFCFSSFLFFWSTSVDPTDIFIFYSHVPQSLKWRIVNMPRATSLQSSGPAESKVMTSTCFPQSQNQWWQAHVSQIEGDLWYVTIMSSVYVYHIGMVTFIVDGLNDECTSPQESRSSLGNGHTESSFVSSSCIFALDTAENAHKQFETLSQ